MNLKNNKGVTGVDIAISIVILIIFVSFIAAMFYNLSKSSKELERKTTATNLAIEIIETMKITEFDLLTIRDYAEINEDGLYQLLGQNIEIPNGYTVNLAIKNPEDNADMGELMKTVSVEVIFKQQKDLTEKVSIETLIKDKDLR